MGSLFLSYKLIELTAQAYGMKVRFISRAVGEMQGGLPAGNGFVSDASRPSVPRLTQSSPDHSPFDGIAPLDRQKYLL